MSPDFWKMVWWLPHVGSEQYTSAPGARRVRAHLVRRGRGDVCARCVRVACRRRCIRERDAFARPHVSRKQKRPAAVGEGEVSSPGAYEAMNSPAMRSAPVPDSDCRVARGVSGARAHTLSLCLFLFSFSSLSLSLLSLSLSPCRKRPKAGMACRVVERGDTGGGRHSSMAPPSKKLDTLRGWRKSFLKRRHLADRDALLPDRGRVLPEDDLRVARCVLRSIVRAGRDAGPIPLSK